MAYDIALAPSRDYWAELPAQETAKRAIEVALVARQPIRFDPHAGASWEFARYDINRLTGESRRKAQEHVDSYDGEPNSMRAAVDQADKAGLAACYLAGLCGDTVVPAIVEPGQPAPITCAIDPLSLADLVIPPPAEEVGAVARRVMAARARFDSVGEADPQAESLYSSWQAHCASVIACEAETRAEVMATARACAALIGHGWITRLALAEALSYRHW